MFTRGRSGWAERLRSGGSGCGGLRGGVFGGFLSVGELFGLSLDVGYGANHVGHDARLELAFFYDGPADGGGAK